MTAMLVAILIFTVAVNSREIRTSSVMCEDSPISSVTDPIGDLVFVYLGEPVPSEQYLACVDVTNVEIENRTDELWCNISLVELPPVSSEIIFFYTFMFDENNNSSDNSFEFPMEDVDTTYTAVYIQANGWTIERAKYYEATGWTNENTQARLNITSAPEGARISIQIPLIELPTLSEVLPWKVLTQTLGDFPAIGDWVPDDGLAYLGDRSPEPWIVEPSPEDAEAPRHNETLVVYGGTISISAVEVLYADDITFATFMYSSDCVNWTFIGKDFEPEKEMEGCTDVEGTPYEGFDVWSVIWDTTGIVEGLYYVRVLMLDEGMHFGEDTIEVYFDPNPPIHQICKPSWGVMVKGTIEFKTETNATDIVFTKWEYLDMNFSLKWEVPKFGEDGGVCTWNAKAALLWYWANLLNKTGGKPLEKLIQEKKGTTYKDLSRYKKDGLDKWIVRRLADKAGKNTYSPATFEEDNNLLRDWLEEKWFKRTIGEKEWRKLSKEQRDKMIDEWIKTDKRGDWDSKEGKWKLDKDKKPIGFEEYKKELAQGPFLIYIFKPGEKEGHVMVAMSANDTELPGLVDGQKKYKVDFMDQYKEHHSSQKCYRVTHMLANGSIWMDWNENNKVDGKDGYWIAFAKKQLTPSEDIMKELGLAKNWIPGTRMEDLERHAATMEIANGLLHSTLHRCQTASTFLEPQWWTRLETAIRTQ